MRRSVADQMRLAAVTTTILLAALSTSAGDFEKCSDKCTDKWAEANDSCVSAHSQSGLKLAACQAKVKKAHDECQKACAVPEKPAEPAQPDS